MDKQTRIENIEENQKTSESKQEPYASNDIDIKSRIAGIIAHDINNYLVAIHGNISLVKTLLNDHVDALTRLAQAAKVCEMMSEYTTRLMSFSRAEKPVFKTEHIGRLLKMSANYAIQNGNIKKEFCINEDLETIEIDHELIKEVFINIFKNAASALEEQGMINVHAENVDIGRDKSNPLKPGRYVKIVIKDNGPGIPSEKLDDIFTPTFSVRSGFGIPLSYYIVRKHNGHMMINSNSDVGTTCTIYLPLKQNIITI